MPSIRPCSIERVKDFIGQREKHYEPREKETIIVTTEETDLDPDQYSNWHELA